MNARKSLDRFKENINNAPEELSGIFQECLKNLVHFSLKLRKNCNGIQEENGD